MAPREFFEQLASTQARAIELARGGGEAGHRVVARHQTDGLGRDGRSFASPPGGLYLSVLLGPPPRAAELLSLGVGAYLARELRERHGVPVRLKWPNDLVVAEAGGRMRKLGGIVVDRLTDVRGREVVVAGVGINVAPVPGRLAPELAARSVGLDELAGAPVALRELEEEVSEATLRAYRTLDQPCGPASVVTLCRELLHGLGARVAVDGRPSGQLVGLAEDGALRLDDHGLELEVRSGTVSVEEAAP